MRPPGAFSFLPTKIATEKSWHWLVPAGEALSVAGEGMPSVFMYIYLSQDPNPLDSSSVVFKKFFIEVKPTCRKVHESQANSSIRFNKVSTPMNPTPSLRKNITNILEVPLMVTSRLSLSSKVSTMQTYNID